MAGKNKPKKNDRCAVQTTRIMRRICLLEFSLAAVILGAISFAFYFHNHLENDRKLCNEYLIKSHLWATEAHLLFDEVMHHNSTPKGIDQVIKLLDGTDRHFQAVKKAQDDIEWFYAPYDKERVKSDIAQLQEFIRKFKELVLVEHDHLTASGFDPDLHKKHDIAFDSFDEKMDELEAFIAAAINREADVFNAAQKFLIIFALLMAVVLGGFLARDIRGHTTADQNCRHFIGTLESENRELTGIVDISSHDLRSPLINIQGFANELETDCSQLQSILQSVQIPSHVESVISTIINESIPESLNYINLSASRMDSLLKGLLKLSRLGRASINIQSLDMDELIGDIISTMQFQIKEHNIDVTIDELPPCMGDQSQIAQVFANLLNNAVKYLGKPENGIIHISGVTGSTRTIYCVRDNGIGISPHDHDKIFQVFHRVDSEHVESGEGLGLTIVKRIVERHKGDVWVESDLGGGSSFFVALPKPAESVLYEEIQCESAV